MYKRPDLPPYLTDAALDDLIRRALAEDVGTGDVTSEATVPEDLPAQGRFLAKDDGVLSGLYVAERVLHAVDPTLEVDWALQDGDAVSHGAIFGTVTGPARSILTAERLALNLLQRMSGIATQTRALAEAARPYPARILDTRKTAPGLRPLDKWAVLHGGGQNHRVGLYDMVLIKDNHVTAAGGVRPAIEAAHRYMVESDRDLPIEVEAGSLQQVREVLAVGGVDYVLLDNMATLNPGGGIDTSRLEEAVSLVGGRIRTEASGNVTLRTVHAIAATGVDYISCGALTHSVHALDISLKINL
ncbi:MAG TPA: carboxylating nicotinate-nucleotide diphosphorylase [Rhodothermales bacterium]|nr:carboxylating nicotinate-nucleotide diphosphorylase [Rhodothermales bacterium]